MSHDGVLTARITVARRKTAAGDRELFALTCNGLYMPPTLRIRPGDRVELEMVNESDEDTNLHVHGLHVSPQSPSDDIFIAIKPGGTFHYTYRIPHDITPGTYWYHSHAAMRSAPQVAGGESGVIIVDGLERYLPDPLRHITEHVIALKDDQVEGDSVKTENLSNGAATNRTINGQQNPVIRIRPGETGASTPGAPPLPRFPQPPDGHRRPPLKHRKEGDYRDVPLPARTRLSLLSYADTYGTIDGLASASGVSGRTLTRHFTEATGLTPLRYQQELRVEQAEHLIAHGATTEAAAARPASRTPGCSAACAPAPEPSTPVRSATWTCWKSASTPLLDN